jgi:hypothetical protein
LRVSGRVISAGTGGRRRLDAIKSGDF